MTIQDISNASYNTTLQQRFSARLLDLVPDVINEAPTVDHHWFRAEVAQKMRDSLPFRMAIANLFRNKALAENALTLPIVETDGVQTAPTDAQITGSTDGFFGDSAYLASIIISLLPYS